MNITPEEAQASLAAIAQTTNKTRKAYGYYGYYSILWGLIWFFGFLANQYLSGNAVGWVWTVLVTVGWVTSAILGINQDRRVRSSVGPRIGFFYMALIGFTILSLFILQPLSERQIVMFVIMIILFGGVVSAIFGRFVSVVIGCVAVLTIALFGYYVLPAYFYLWVAIFCGLTMAAIGLTIRLRWR
jgi:hypothetical protein